MDKYITKDLGIASLLLTLGHEITSITWRGQSAYFAFDNAVECRDKANKYQFGHVLVNARTHFENIKLIKRKLKERSY